MTNEQRETIRGFVSDMLALERHILEPIDHQAGDENVGRYPYAATLVRSIKSDVESHITALGAALDSLGGHAGHPFKEAWSAFTGAAASAINAARPNAVSRGLRDDYTALALASAGYTLLHATALAMGNRDVGTLAERHLKDYAPLVVQIGRTLPQIALDELRAAGEQLDPSVTTETLQKEQEAWSSHGSSQSQLQSSTSGGSAFSL